MKLYNFLVLLHIGPFFTLVCSLNYIVNGGFEDPVVAAGSFIASNNITGWTGAFKILNMQRALGYNQYADLQKVYGTNGYI